MLEQAAKLISAGGVVAFPTETVYGLGADAFNEKACMEIYKIKKRDVKNPLIIHVSSYQQACEIAEFSQVAVVLAKNFWPGPVTIVAPLKSQFLSKSSTAGLDTVAIRIPSNEVALRLIQLTGKPIAAPSANPWTRISATKAAHVKHYFPEMPCVDGGNSTYGIESTIVDTTTKIPTILRHGFITKETIEKILSKECNTDIKKLSMCSNASKENSVMKAPGMSSKHYSPHTSLMINAITSNSKERVALNFGKSSLQGKLSMNLSQNGDLVEAASNLYAMLIELDDYAQKHNCKSIVCAPIPCVSIGMAINDRLERAASAPN